MTDIFNDAPPADQQQSATPPPATIPSDLSEYIGEGKKYASVEAALKSVGPAQAHIARLESELAQARQQASSGAAVDDVLKAVQDLLAKPTETPPGVVDDSRVASLVDGLLTAREVKAKEQANIATFRSELEKTYGEKAKEVFEQAAASAGISPQELGQLATRSPQAALRLFDQRRGAPALSGDVNTNSFALQKQNPIEKKSVMFGTTSATLLEQWRRSASLVNKE